MAYELEARRRLHQSGRVVCGLSGHGEPGSGWVRFIMATAKTKNTVEEIGGTCPTNGASKGIECQQPFRVLVELQGVCPILFHRWNCESVESKSKAKKGSAEKKSDDVESYVYRNEKGEISLPGEYLRGAIIGAAKFQQDPRSPRKSAADLFKASIVSLTELSSFGVKDWDYLDKRRVCIQRNAITRSRPAMKEGWKASFILMVNLPEYIDEQLLNSTVQAAGKLIGLGDFRPSYGRFNVIRFEKLDD